MPDATPEQIATFIERWERSGAAERANHPLFLSELCDLLDLPRPDPSSPDTSTNSYVFERAVVRRNPDGSTSTGFIDCYRSSSFVWESKQGAFAKTTGEGQKLLLDAATATPNRTGHGIRGTAGFDRALERAYHQGRGYITALPPEEGRPPFLVICDVGATIDLYAEFTGTGGHYERFPDPVSHRITLRDLHRPEIRDRLRRVWLDPHSLDPSKHAAAVTREVAKALAELGKSLEADGHDPQIVARFLQRCLFTMFAEDIGLLPAESFLNLLTETKNSPAAFPVLVEGLWRDMATGAAFSAALRSAVPYFNGGLFEETTALPLRGEQIVFLIHGAKSDWSAVEPAIFGTLLVRALDPRERHKLGAEFTPRAYVERLIRPTIIGPLREEWDAVRVAAATLHEDADQAETHADRLEAAATAKLAAGASAEAKKLGAEAASLRREAKKNDAEALAQAIAFHRYLCGLKFLDPACGTANFLYVTMEHMKRLEAEVLQLINALGGDASMEMQGFRVRPEQFIGLEVNKQAVAIAELVLWIGYFQWQHKTTGKADTGDRPLLPRDRSIFEQDAVLAYDERIPRRDPASGEILTIWDGHSTKPHPVTGKEVPDESARKVLFDFINPRRAEWPKADFIVGNPPFIGASRMREALGDGYVEALRKAWKGDVPESADFVMFWWCKAAAETVQGRCKRFGFITTNSIHQTFNRRVIEPFVAAVSNRQAPLHLAYAIPDHPWIDSTDGAAVRISMTVAAPGKSEGVLEKVIAERVIGDGEHEVALSRSGGVLAANLQIGADLTSCSPMMANSKLVSRGVQTIGEAFVLKPDETKTLKLTDTEAGFSIRPYLNGKDLTDKPRGVSVIDFFGLSEDEARTRAPACYQRLYTEARPHRLQNSRASYRNNWWILGEPQPALRQQMDGLPRVIVTPVTAKHRFFVFINTETLPDQALNVICIDDAYAFGILSSNLHVTWALAAGGRLGIGNDPRYNNTRCFDPFPFPALEEGELKQRIRDLGERLDAHRKRQQELHPGLTLTGMYNVLEKLRAGEALSAKDKAIHDQGLVTLLKQLHDELDEAVLEAYGWGDLSRSVGVSPTFGEKEGGRDAHAPCEELLARLVALNHERAAEEKRGLVRWLRPDYQAPGETTARQSEISLPGESTETPPDRSTETPATWPAELPAQVAAVRKLLPAIGQDPEALAARFGRKSKKRSEQIAAILATLKALGHIS